MKLKRLHEMTRDELLTASEALYGVSEGEERLSHEVIKATRKPQECMCPACGPHPIPIGSPALRESAKTAFGFGSCYTCEPCVLGGLLLGAKPEVTCAEIAGEVSSDGVL